MNHWMDGRFWVKLISSEAFSQYMEHKGFTARSLAAAADKELKKMKAMRGNRPASCSHSTIGHLMSGKRNTCSPQMARAIERALGTPPGLLFVPQVLHVVRDSAA